MSAFDPKRTLASDFRTFQVDPKDLLGSPTPAEGEVDWRLAAGGRSACGGGSASRCSVALQRCARSPYGRSGKHGRSLDILTFFQTPRAGRTSLQRSAKA